MSLWTRVTNVDFVLSAVGLFVLLVLIQRKSRVPKGLTLPPGPPGRPIVGNLADMPSRNMWETFTRWRKQYGDLVYLKVFQQNIVLVNSAEIAQDLFETRSSIYSDRCRFVMLDELVGFGYSFSRMPYGTRWRRHRRVFHQHFHPMASAAYYSTHTEQTRYLLQQLHESPKKFTAHLRHLAGATIMEVVYGIKVLPTRDPYIEIAEKALEAVAEAGGAGSFLVDSLPILKYLPEWMPGAGFRKKARRWSAPIADMAMVPFVAVKQAISAGTAEPSVTASLLGALSERNDVADDEEEIVRNVSGVAYAAGSDTTVSALNSFMLTMVLYPEAQRKAQAELDSVVGEHRLPTFEDQESLPYTNALIKEVYRWHPVIPVAVAHRVTQDDVYGKYFIPRGSTVFGNTWAILHDEKTYGPDTHEFRPERFLKPGVKDPLAAFGYGRRICPGRYMADNTIFLAVSSILKVFNISLATDDNGQEIPVKPGYTSGFISHPEPFQCAIRLRSASSEGLFLGKTDN